MLAVKNPSSYNSHIWNKNDTLKYTDQEKDKNKTAWLLGLSYSTVSTNAKTEIKLWHI
jgi:hypothetical protein